jgi:hypothetical protein
LLFLQKMYLQAFLSGFLNNLDTFPSLSMLVILDFNGSHSFLMASMPFHQYNWQLSHSACLNAFILCNNILVYATLRIMFTIHSEDSCHFFTGQFQMNSILALSLHILFQLGLLLGPIMHQFS